MKKLHSGNKIIALSVNNLREKKEKEDCNVGNYHILGAIKREKSLVYYKNSTMKLHTMYQDRIRLWGFHSENHLFDISALIRI